MTQTSSTVDFQPIGKYPFPIASTEFSGKFAQKDEIDIVDAREGSEQKNAIQPDLKGGPDDTIGSLDSLAKEISRSLGSSHAEALLQSHADEIAHEILPGTILLEVGAVNADKTRLLLKAIESQHKIVDYYALDTEKTELEETVQDLHRRPDDHFQYVQCHGLLGTEDDARTWLSKWETRQRPKYLLSLGPRMETSQDWKKWVDALRSSIEDRDRVVLGVDGKKAVPEDGEESAVDDDWSLKTEWKEDEGKLVQYLVALKDGELEGKKIGKGEKIEVAHEYRFDEAGRDRMFRESKLQSFQEFMSEDGSYELFVLSPLRDA